MALSVETGAGLADAESYASVADARAYAANMGLTLPSQAVAIEVALRRATLWLDTTYRGRFVGVRRFGRQQALEWPRVGAYVRLPGVADLGYAALAAQDITLPYDAIPREIVSATIEAACREAASPNLLLPDAGETGMLKLSKVGDVTTEFFQTARVSAGSTGFAAIDAILSALLGATSGYTARASRG